MKFNFLLFVLLFPFIAFAQSPACSSDNHRAFDFWIGEWKVTQPNGDLAGHSSIRLIHGGCVIEENWTGAAQSRGSSFNHYDSNIDKWKQKWVDNSGANIEFEGEITNNVLITFAETIHPTTKAKVYNKMTIARVNEDRVDQTWEQSTDKETWNTVFIGHYARMATSANSTLAFAIYDTFSVAYQRLIPEKVAHLYQQDAIYISGKDGTTKGQQAILESFTSFFDNMREQGTQMDISFKIISREESDVVIADIGYYQLQFTRSDGTLKESFGKFSTVMTRDEKNNWKFSSDVYHPAQKEEYEAAISIWK